MDKNAYTTAKYNEKTGFVPMRNNASCYQHRSGPRGNGQGHYNSDESKCLRGDDGHFLSIIDAFVVTYFLTISTRRFLALPSSERLSAIGFSWPQPTAVSLVAAIPFWTTAFMTDFALCKERVLLL